MSFNLRHAAVNLQNVGLSDIAYRKLGSGPALILVHGFPLNGMTWRGMIPLLATTYTCYVLDLPGAGLSRWTSKSTDFDFGGSAKSIKRFADSQGLKKYTLCAHDTGATIARELAIMDKERVQKLVAINTEIPNHRPPGIQLSQWMSYLPFFDWSLRRGFGNPSFLKSGRGFAFTLQDVSQVESGSEFHNYFIKPVVECDQYRLGFRYRLQGIDWTLLDSLATRHAEIECPVLFIWGEACGTFPVDLARTMVSQFTNASVTFQTIPGAKTFCQDENPNEVAALCLEFLRA